MDKKILNEAQFRKLVIEEAKKFISKKEASQPIVIENKEIRKISFDKVESLINEIESMNKSISSLTIDSEEVIEEIVKLKKNKQDRDLDVIEHNKKKNILHVNEGEKEKWERMLKYSIPSDDKR